MFYGFFISEAYTFIVHIFNALFSKISDKMNELNTHISTHRMKTEAFPSQGMICIRLNDFGSLLQFSWHIAFSLSGFMPMFVCASVSCRWTFFGHIVYAFAEAFVVISTIVIVIISKYEKKRVELCMQVKWIQSPTNNTIHALLLCCAVWRRLQIQQKKKKLI